MGPVHAKKVSEPDETSNWLSQVHQVNESALIYENMIESF